MEKSDKNNLEDIITEIACEVMYARTILSELITYHFEEDKPDPRFWMYEHYERVGNLISIASEYAFKIEKLTDQVIY